MNGISLAIHIRVLALTLGLVLSTIMWTRDVALSPLLFLVFSGLMLWTGYGWLMETMRQMTRVKRHGLILGAFGLGMFVFSYAMVPLYHILCHGSASINEGSGEVLNVNLFTERYRGLPIGVSLSKKQMALSSKGHDIVYVTLENQSMKSLGVHMKIASQPKTVQPYFGLVTPSNIELAPGQRTTFPVEVKFLADIPDDLSETAILFLFQDQNGVGQFGKGDAWEKMHLKDNYNGVR